MERIELVDDERDYDGVLDWIGDARMVLIGEATHGTHEFYLHRARLTRRLIEQKGFTAVAAEADWPDAWRANRYASGSGDDLDAAVALEEFKRFPTWMWRNREVIAFIEWLRTYNLTRHPDRPAVGFYGLDLYSLYASMAVVVKYLDRVDRSAASRARKRYACFERHADAEDFGEAAGLGLEPECQAEAVAQLLEMQARRGADDDAFFAQQNARLVKNAGHYYTAMFGSHVESWNVRDRHMAEMLDALVEWMHARRQSARIVVWAHNSHLGDARATEMGQNGELNLGQLVRERYGEQACLIGQTTYEGSVLAASHWEGPARVHRVLPARPDSYEHMLHEVGLPRFALRLSDTNLPDARLERAIGVVYTPQSERYSHYFYSSLPTQFDVVIHHDRTRAVEALDTVSVADQAELPETFPFSL